MTHKIHNVHYRHLNFLSMIYCTLLIASVLLPYKLINLFGYTLPGGIFIFPLTYLLSGAIAETYGREIAIRMIYSSVFCLLIFNIIINMIIRIPSAPGASNQEVFVVAFGHGIRLSIGCLLGLICSDLTNVYRLTKLKIIFKGKYFVSRLLWSTALSEALFNAVTYLITYLFIIPIHQIVSLMVSSWALKMIYSLVMIVPILLLMNFLKKSESIDGTDVIDDSISKFNPESLIIQLIKQKNNTSKNTHAECSP